MRRSVYILLTIMLGLACKKPYNPTIVATGTNYLVVEGVINTGQDSTIIHLSRTVPISSNVSSNPELGASVAVLNNAGNSYPLAETGNGYYKAPPLNLSSSNQYSLKIMTSDGKVYQSDFVPVKNSPPIDSVYYRIQSNGLEIYADTHDPANNTRYYRWDYVGTYEFHSAFNSEERLVTTPFDTVLARPVADQIYVCWRNDTASTILLNSSAKLAKDVITENAIEYIPSNSEKIEDRYSILVKQYALTPDAFNYYQQLKKNTEQLGTIFDAQPSELPGNIHCTTNPSEAVIGYITAGAPAEARIFINNSSLPNWLAVTPYSGCVLDTDLFQRVEGNSQIINEVQIYIYSGINMPINSLEPPGSSHILGYTAALPGCVDCTLRGTNIQPSFWTNQ
jgi:hypothetical protein